MRKLKTSFTTLIMLFILLISCHEPEIEIKREKLQPIAYTSLVQEKALGLAMELAGFSNKSVSGGRLMAGLANYKPDSILKVLQSDSTHYTYTLQLEGGANLNSFRNLVFRRVANGYYGSVVEYSFKNGVFNPEKFTGTINRYDLEGKLFFKATLENGNVAVSNSGKINYQCIEFAWEAHDGTPCVPLGSGGPGGDGCSLVMIVSPCGHGSSGGPYTPTPDGGSYVPDPYGAGGGTGGSGSGGSSGGPSAPVDPSEPTYEGEPIGVIKGRPSMEVIIDDWKDKICLTPSFSSNNCLSNVWSKLVDGNSAFYLLKNFVNQNPTARVCLDAVPSLPNENGVERNGITKNSDPIQIQISERSAANRSALEVARTLFHELIHAEMWRKIQSVGGKLDPSNFPGLFDYYSRYISIPNGNGGFTYPDGTPQHNLMAAHYINLITDALMDFDGADKTDVNVRDSYEAVAWEGLEQTTLYQNKPSYEQQSIIILRNSLVNNRSKCN